MSKVKITIPEAITEAPGLTKNIYYALGAIALGLIAWAFLGEGHNNDE